MALTTRLKRKSAINVGLPFGRLGPVVDGGDLDTAAQRRTITNYALMPDIHVSPGGGLDTRRKRGSAIMVGLPFGRVGNLPDGSDLEDQNERRHAAFRYEISGDIIIPADPGIIVCNAQSLDAEVGGSITYLPRNTRVRPAQAPIGKSIDLDVLVNSVDKQYTGRAGPRHFPVYNFGSGRNRKTFTELL